MTMQVEVAREAKRREADGRGTRPRRRWPRGARAGVFLALPYLLVFLIFRIAPSLGGLVLSLGNYSITGAFKWKGLGNFAKLFSDSLFWNSLGVTFIYTAIAVPATVAFSLLVALAANRSMRGVAVYRTLYFLPVITSLVTSGVVWQWIYSTDGPANWLLSVVGLGPWPWLGSQSSVLPSIAVLGVWTRFGYDMLILLAALLAVPSEYYEAAKLDGASAWQRLRYISLPSIRPAMFAVVILEIIQSFQVFDLVYVMTGGGPVRASYSMVYFIYDQGFHFFNFGYASAAGVVLFVVVLVVALVQRRLFRDEETD